MLVICFHILLPCCFEDLFVISWLKWQLRVELNGDQTQKVFDRILINLGRTTPPVPGFRVQKGGKWLRY